MVERNENKRRFQALLLHNPNPVALFRLLPENPVPGDLSVEFLDVNPALAAMTGMDAADLIGRKGNRRDDDGHPSALSSLVALFSPQAIKRRRISPRLDGEVEDDGEGGSTKQAEGIDYDDILTNELELFSEPLQTEYKGTIVMTGNDGGLAIFTPHDAQRKFVSDNASTGSNSSSESRVQMEEALRQSEERHRTLFESMLQGVVYQDAATGGIIAANPSAERILGLSVDQMMGRSSVDPRWKSVHEDGSDWPGDTHPSMTSIRTGEAVTDAIMGVFHPLTNSHHWISIDAVPLFKPGADRPFQVYSTFTDITEQKRAEREILRAKEKAEEADKLKSAFLANMSHEIRTPLNGIMGHIDLALSNSLDESYRTENLEGLEVAKESGQLLVAIINDILDLSKIEAGQMAINTSNPFSVRKMVDQTLRVGHVMVNQCYPAAKDIQITHHVDESISPCIFGDNIRVHQIMNNLISNAVKFTDQGSVDLRVRIQGDLPSLTDICNPDPKREERRMLEFRVRDTGRGIPSEQLEVVFEPFRQVDFSDTRKFGGTGLGLTISRKLIELMGGKLWVDSEVGVGSSFYFTLPYNPAPNVETAVVNEEKVQMEDGKNAASQGTAAIAISGRVLIAEDDLVSRKVAAKMVEQSGCTVVLAENGKIAVDKFASDPSIDLILMDVQMCVMGGLEATSKIRDLEAKQNEGRRIPIVALSAAAMASDRERGAVAGMTDYLTKPVNRMALLKTLGKYLGRHDDDAASSASKSFGGE